VQAAGSSRVDTYLANYIASQPNIELDWELLKKTPPGLEISFCEPLYKQERKCCGSTIYVI
jgi:hypothetical protein